MIIQEATSAANSEVKPKGLRTRAAVVVGAVLLAAGTTWAANTIADNLCHPPEAAAIGDHGGPAGFCDEYQGFKDDVAGVVGNIIPHAPFIPIVHEPVWNPNAHPVS